MSLDQDLAKALRGLMQVALPDPDEEEDTEFNEAMDQAREALMWWDRANPSQAETIAFLDAKPLVEALWWFIENAPEESSEIFFRLRERVREAGE